MDAVYDKLEEAALYIERKSTTRQNPSLPSRISSSHHDMETVMRPA